MYCKSYYLVLWCTINRAVVLQVTAVVVLYYCPRATILPGNEPQAQKAQELHCRLCCGFYFGFKSAHQL